MGYIISVHCRRKTDLLKLVSGKHPTPACTETQSCGMEEETVRHTLSTLGQIDVRVYGKPSF